MISSRQPTILLCDDNPLNRKLITAMLTGMPYRIREASSGREALATVFSEHESIDLILLDISMKDVSGVEVCQAIRCSDQERHRVVPIIAYTANAMTDECEQYISIGFNDVLTKPTTLVNLMRILHTYLA